MRYNAGMRDSQYHQCHLVYALGSLRSSTEDETRLSKLLDQNLIIKQFDWPPLVQRNCDVTWPGD